MTTARRTTKAIVAMALGLGSLATSAPAGAASFSPDASIADGDPGSLRDVIENQATDPAGDTVTLEVDATYLLDDCTGSLQHGATPLTIVGNGATIELPCDEQWILRQGAASLTVRDVTLSFTGAGDETGGVRSDGPVDLDGVTIDGVNNDGISAPDVTAVDVALRGAGLDNSGLESGGDVDATRVTVTGFGDGIIGDGAVVVLDSVISGNAEGGIFGGSQPARIERTSVVDNQTGIGLLDGIILDSTIADNDATSFPSDGAGIEARGDVVVVNSTITGNESGASGGGIFTTGELTLVHATVVGNTAPSGANVAGATQRGTLRSFASVLASPLGGGGNCAELTVASTLHDVEGGGDTCGFDLADVSDVGLDPIGDNGGSTRTMLPRTTSPLIDVVPAADCTQAAAIAGFAVTSDQRGVTRPQGDGCDVGAVEVVPAGTPVSAPAPAPTTPRPTAAPATAARPTSAQPRFTG